MPDQPEAPIMTINEKDRLDLRQEFERLFNNPRIAEIAMEAMPPIDYTQLATKRDLDALGAELRGEMSGLSGELRGEMAELRGSFAKLEAKVDAGFANVEGRFAKVDGRFANVEGGFAKVDGRFAQVDGRFANIEGGFAMVDGRFAQVDGRFANIEGAIAELRGDLKTDIANNLRMMFAAQLTTMVMLGAWVTAVT